TYNRQLSGNLTSAEYELQSSNKKLGILGSQLLSEKELSNYWENSKLSKDKEFEDFVKKYNLEIKSFDSTIAKLKQTISYGESSIGPDQCNINEECIISYTWRDNNRFVLKDPNIFEHNNEIFESNQIFKKFGTIWQQEDGSLQTRRLILQEVNLGENGNYKDIPNAKAEIVNSTFKYHNPPVIETEFGWRDSFRLRMIAVGSITIFPNSGDNRFGLGVQVFNLKRFGINTHTAFHFEDAEKIEQRLGVSYCPRVFNQDLNLAIGISVGTPFAHMFNNYSINADLIFYLHQ
ncbi:hypothetical protein LCGC14_1923280, partial [marine sediment metagenome]